MTQDIIFLSRSQINVIIEQVQEYSTNFNSSIHGHRHWICVSYLGIYLARKHNVNPLIPFLFGLFHDSMRDNDNDDEFHGSSGAELFKTLYKNGFLSGISDSVLDTVVNACRTHTSAPPTDDLSLGVCYDADRLTLWRVYKTPEASYMSSETAKDMANREITSTMHNDYLVWHDVIQYLFDESECLYEYL